MKLKQKKILAIGASMGFALGAGASLVWEAFDHEFSAVMGAFAMLAGGLLLLARRSSDADFPRGMAAYLAAALVAMAMHYSGGVFGPVGQASAMICVLGGARCDVLNEISPGTPGRGFAAAKACAWQRSGASTACSVAVEERSISVDEACMNVAMADTYGRQRFSCLGIRANQGVNLDVVF